MVARAFIALTPTEPCTPSVRGSVVFSVNTPVSRSPYSAENPPVFSDAVPSVWMSMIENAPPTSLRWNGSTSSRPSSET
jgi:hypothetical protein